MSKLHVFLYALAACLVFESFRDEGHKALIPIVGAVPTLMQGPRTGGLLAGLGGLGGGIFGGKSTAQG